MSKNEVIWIDITLTSDNLSNIIKSGWKTSILKIPGAEVDKVLLNGTALANDYWSVERELETIKIINQPLNVKTDKLVVLFKLTKNLSTLKATITWSVIATILSSIASIYGSFAILNKPPTTVIATPTITVTAKPTITATSLPTDLNPFDNELYPKLKLYPRRECGIVNGRPVYPVFIPYSSSNLSTVKREFCKDASYLGGENNGVLIASFSDENNADMFVAFIGKHFKGAWKGKGE